jgi:hypothetical protein
MLKAGVWYVVTKDSDDGTFLAGEHIKLLTDGCLLCREAAGWIDAEDVPSATRGMQVAGDSDYVRTRKAELLAELQTLDNG